MEGIPEYVDYNEILQTFLQIDGVVRVHNLRIWVLYMHPYTELQYSYNKIIIISRH